MKIILAIPMAVAAFFADHGGCLLLFFRIGNGGMLGVLGRVNRKTIQKIPIIDADYALSNNHKTLQGNLLFGLSPVQYGGVLGCF